MKTTITFLLLLLLAVTPALANGTPPAPAPSSSYAPSQQSMAATLDSNSRSDADASARARAASVSGSSSQGGSATAAGGVGTASSTSTTGPATSGASIADHSSTRALGLSLPGPSVPSALPSARDCIGTTNWSSAAPLFLGSGGSSNQGVIPECMVAQQIHVLRAACQFDTANRLEARLIGKLIDITVEPAADVNLTDEQCRLRTAPPTPIVFAPPAATAPPEPLVMSALPACEAPETAASLPKSARTGAKRRHGCGDPTKAAAK